MAAQQSTPASNVQLAYLKYKSCGYTEPLSIVLPLINMEAKIPCLVDTTDQLMDSAQTSMDALHYIMHEMTNAEWKNSPSHYERHIQDLEKHEDYSDTLPNVKSRIANVENKIDTERQQHVKANDELQALQQQMATLQTERAAHQQDYDNTMKTKKEEQEQPPFKRPKLANGGVCKYRERMDAISEAMEGIDNKMDDIKQAIAHQERKCNKLLDFIKNMEEQKKRHIERRDYLIAEIDKCKRQIIKLQQPEGQRLRDALNRAHDKLNCVYRIRKAQEEIARLQQNLRKHDQDE